MLYVVLHVIRLLVVIVLLPVLTKGGYGMNYKQLAVLVFAGLRGVCICASDSLFILPLKRTRFTGSWAGEAVQA